MCLERIKDGKEIVKGMNEWKGKGIEKRSEAKRKVREEER